MSTLPEEVTTARMLRGVPFLDGYTMAHSQATFAHRPMSGGLLRPLLSLLLPPRSHCSSSQGIPNTLSTKHVYSA